MTLYFVKGGTASEARRLVETLSWDGLVLIHTVRSVRGFLGLRRIGWEVLATIVE